MLHLLIMVPLPQQSMMSLCLRIPSFIDTALRRFFSQAPLLLCSFLFPLWIFVLISCLNRKTLLTAGFIGTTSSYSSSLPKLACRAVSEVST